MECSSVKVSDELLLIKAAHNGSVNAEDVLYSSHKKELEKALYKYKFLHVILNDLSSHIECYFRISIHQYRADLNMRLINFASWFIKNSLERRCAAI